MGRNDHYSKPFSTTEAFLPSRTDLEHNYAQKPSSRLVSLVSPTDPHEKETHEEGITPHPTYHKGKKFSLKA